MASRQRSFFDKKPTVSHVRPLEYKKLTIQNRGQWNKPRKPQYVNDPQPVAKTMSAPAIAASSASKAKLKAFSFVGALELSSTKERNNDTIEDDKENNNRTPKRLKSMTSQTFKTIGTQKDVIEDEWEDCVRTVKRPRLATSQKSKTAMIQSSNGHKNEQEDIPTTAKCPAKTSSQKSKSTPSQISAHIDQRSPQKQASQGLEEHREYPQTPIGRVPLVELINNKEDMFEQVPSLTPVERIVWNHSPQSSNPASNLITPLARRGNKRARSSSPVSSSQNDESTNSVTDASKRSFDLQTLQTSLRTPQADPANDLWNRYSLYTTDRTTPAAPAIANFLHSSSPQTPAHNHRGRNNGLRRSLSCSTEWPTSVIKRRKIYQSYSQDIEKNEFVVSGGETVPSESRMSRVSLLLEKIQEGLVKHAAGPQITGPLSSSQITCGNDKGPHMEESPLAQVRVQSRNLPESSSQPLVVGEPTIIRCSQQDLSITAGSEEVIQEVDSASEFGDDEINLEFMEEVDASFQSKRQVDKVPTCTGPSPVAYERYQTSKDQEQISLVSSKLDKSSQQKLVITKPDSQSYQSDILQDLDDDVFDSDGSDLFAADLEHVAALYDQQPHSITDEHNHEHGDDKPENQSQPHAVCGKDAVLPTPICRTAYVEVSSDNEYGDDLDFERIAVEYAGADQAVRTGSQGQSPVRVLDLSQCGSR